MLIATVRRHTITNIWVAADHHFGHSNLVHKFKRADGTPLRDFASTHEHDEYIILMHNELFKPEDHVYLLGDVVINRRNLPILTRLMGKLRLVRGNHDVFKTQEYLDVGIEEIYGVRVFPNHNLIFSHIPLHPNCLDGRAWTNIHGHLHYNYVRTDAGHPDTRYRCVSLEHTDYKPVLLMR